MKTFLTTFHEIACNNLMPENCHHYFNHIYPHKKSIFNILHNGIIPLPDNTLPEIQKNIIKLKDYIYRMPMISSEVKSDWDHFASKKIPVSYFYPVNIFSPYFSCTPKVSFYAILIGYGTAAAMYSILLRLKRLKSKNHQKVFLRHINYTIQRVLSNKPPIDPEAVDTDTESPIFNSPNESSIIIRNLNKLGVLLIYLEITKKYSLSDYPEFLIPKEVWYEIYPGINDELKEIRQRKSIITQIHRKINPAVSKGAGLKSMDGTLPGSPATRLFNQELSTGNTSNLAMGKEPDLSGNKQVPSQEINKAEVYLSATDVMHLLGVNKQTLKRYRDKHDLPYEPRKYNKFIYPEEKIRKWMKEHPELIKKKAS